MSDAPLTFGRVLLRAALLFGLVAFALMGLCSGLFTVMDLSGPKPGRDLYIGVFPYVMLVVALLGVWAFVALLKRFWPAR